MTNPYQHDPYGGQDPYGAQDPHAAQNPYGTPGGADPYGQANPYGAQNPYGTPPGYGVARPPFNPVSAQSNLQLNYWLSAFFGLIPAIIFYVVDKDKHPLLDDHLKENLNFTLTRVIVGLIMIIPFIGWIVGGIGAIVLFIFAIIGAMNGPNNFRMGQPYRFPFAIRFIS